MRFCLVCGRPADSKEHYIPKWLSEATGRGNDPLIFGTVAGSDILSQTPRGTSLGATHRNLCERCNNGLGEKLEGPVCGFLSPLVGSGPAPELTAYLNALVPREMNQLAWWALLRAIQLNEQIANPRICGAHRDAILAGLAEIIDGKLPSPPSATHVQAAQAKAPEWGFMLSPNLYDRYRDMIVKHTGSYLWSMQANSLLLAAAHAPEAQVLRDSGWGYGVHPFSSRAMEPYQDMRDMVGKSHIDTRAAKIFGFMKYR